MNFLTSILEYIEDQIFLNPEWVAKVLLLVVCAAFLLGYYLG